MAPSLHSTPLHRLVDCCFRFRCRFCCPCHCRGLLTIAHGAMPAAFCCLHLVDCSVAVARCPWRHPACLESSCIAPAVHHLWTRYSRCAFQLLQHCSRTISFHGQRVCRKGGNFIPLTVCREGNFNFILSTVGLTGVSATASAMELSGFSEKRLATTEFPSGSASSSATGVRASWY
jgi:hypothetical protein